MHVRWLVLAQLLLTLPGCFDSHGMPGDVGPVPDAGMCMALPGSAMELRCEMRGDVGHAIVTTSPGWCCSSGTPTPSVATLGTSTGTSHDITIAWSACDCCRACRCVGPIQELDVSLGTLAPGFHQVTAGGLSCTIEHFPPVTSCRAGAADEARFARFLYTDQSFVATVVAPSGGCGCDPRFTLDTRAIDLTDVELCDCCDVCDCIDFGYELSVDGGVLPLGEHPVVIPHGAATTRVVDRASVHPMPTAPTGLRIVAPDPMLRRTGPEVHWAVVSGTEVVCCVQPSPVVDRGIGPAGEIVLSVASATESDCECVGGPEPYEAWFPLVSLPSGTHTVRAGAAVATVTVP